MDPEEKVRAAVCKALRQLELDVVKHHVPKTTLQKVSMRCKDKKVKLPAKYEKDYRILRSISLYSHLFNKKH
jgi:hypothetical protein